MLGIILCDVAVFVGRGFSLWIIESGDEILMLSGVVKPPIAFEVGIDTFGLVLCDDPFSLGRRLKWSEDFDPKDFIDTADLIETGELTSTSADAFTNSFNLLFKLSKMFLALILLPCLLSALVLAGDGLGALFNLSSDLLLFIESLWAIRAIFGLKKNS